MPRIHEMVESKFLKKEDAADGILVTIKGVEKRDVGTEAEPEQKWVLLLAENKPLVLNSTNLALLEKALGSDDTDNWIGQQVVLFNDENVSFGGKLTGGVRVDVNRTKRYHAKNAQAAPNTAPKEYPQQIGGTNKHFDDFKDDIPF
jgi:hypothetical protein